MAEMTRLSVLEGLAGVVGLLADAESLVVPEDWERERGFQPPFLSIMIADCWVVVVGRGC
jgi:hypothetical protein